MYRSTRAGGAIQLFVHLKRVAAGREAQAGDPPPNYLAWGPAKDLPQGRRG